MSSSLSPPPTTSGSPSKSLPAARPPPRNCRVSAMISTAWRVWPSWARHSRHSRRPSSATGLPLDRKRAALAPWAPQTVMSKKLGLSSHSPALVRRRVLTARRSRQTSVPFASARSSGVAGQVAGEDDPVDVDGAHAVPPGVGGEVADKAVVGQRDGSCEANARAHLHALPRSGRRKAAARWARRIASWAACRWRSCGRRQTTSLAKPGGTAVHGPITRLEVGGHPRGRGRSGRRPSR